MLDNKPDKTGSRSKAARVLIAAVALVAGAAFALLEWRAGADRPVEQAVLTAEARAYLGSLDLEDVDMAAMDNSLGQTLVEITGTIRNLGSRHVRSMRLNCVFFDVYGIELHRVLSTIVRSGEGLAPGAESQFRLPFDAIPDGWNQVLPSLYIAEIVFDPASAPAGN